MKQISIRRYKPQSGLEKSTKRIIVQNIVKKADEEEFFSDLMDSGLACDNVKGMSSTGDAMIFYKKNTKEILSFMNKYMRENELDLEEIFGFDFDENDPLCLKMCNRYLIVEFVFLETARTIAENIGVEL